MANGINENFSRFAGLMEKLSRLSPQTRIELTVMLEGERCTVGVSSDLLRRRASSRSLALEGPKSGQQTKIILENAVLLEARVRGTILVAEQNKKKRVLTYAEAKALWDSVPLDAEGRLPEGVDGAPIPWDDRVILLPGFRRRGRYLLIGKAGSDVVADGKKYWNSTVNYIFIEDDGSYVLVANHKNLRLNGRDSAEFFSTHSPAEVRFHDSGTTNDKQPPSSDDSLDGAWFSVVTREGEVKLAYSDGEFRIRVDSDGLPIPDYRKKWLPFEPPKKKPAEKRKGKKKGKRSSDDESEILEHFGAEPGSANERALALALADAADILHPDGDRAWERYGKSYGGDLTESQKLVKTNPKVATAVKKLAKDTSFNWEFVGWEALVSAVDPKLFKHAPAFLKDSSMSSTNYLRELLFMYYTGGRHYRDSLVKHSTALSDAVKQLKKLSPELLKKVMYEELQQEDNLEELVDGDTQFFSDLKKLGDTGGELADKLRQITN